MEATVKTALILAGLSWDAPWQRHHIIASQLSTLGYDVDFVQSLSSTPFSLAAVWRRLMTRRAKVAHNPKPNGVTLRKVFNMPPGTWGNRLIGRIAAAFAFGEETHYDIVVFYIPKETTTEIINRVDHSLLVYDCVRDFTNWNGANTKEITDSERELVSRADLIVCDSFWLEAKLSQSYGIKPVQILPTIPSALIPQDDGAFRVDAIKRVLYFGSLSAHVDVSFLSKLHEYGCTVKFIGRSNIPLPSFIQDLGYEADQRILRDRIASECDLVVIPYKGRVDGVVPSKIPIAIASGRPILISKFFDSIQLANDELLSSTIFAYEDNNENIGEILASVYRKANLDADRASKCREFLDRNREENLVSKLGI